MENLKILSKRESKKIIELIKSSFDFTGTLNYCMLMNNKNKIYIVNNDLSKIDLEKLRINSIGMYFAELSHGDIRLSIEGSQLIGDDCSKNLLIISNEDAKLWLKGIDLNINQCKKNFYIIKSGEDYLGCGKAVDGKILNYVPKNRRVSNPQITE